MRILPRMRGRDLYGGILLPAERKGVLQRLRPRGAGDRRGTGDAAASGGNEIEEGRPSAARFLCDPVSFSLPEKETGSPAKGKEGKVRTAVLNLAQNILVFSCPPCQTLPPERALRIAASEEASCIPLPSKRRKLHIRWLLLPFQTVTAALGHSLGIRGHFRFCTALFLFLED